jgi:Protein of unknown function (DUF1348)
VRFQYESRDQAHQWWRSYGNELWEFDSNGLMSRREASIMTPGLAGRSRSWRKGLSSFWYQFGSDARKRPSRDAARHGAGCLVSPSQNDIFCVDQLAVAKERRSRSDRRISHDSR